MSREKYILEGEKLPILTYPNPILAAKAVPVTEFTPRLEEIVKNMLYTMYNAPGIGLAAPQIGIGQRIFVLDVDYDREIQTNSSGEDEVFMSNFNPMVFINPEISDSTGSVLYEEGCLSVPGIYEEVKRFKSIRVKYQNIKGESLEIEASELLSICIQHENDHLNGIVFIERLSNLKKTFYKKKIKKEKIR
jgi:peptide deformylase